MPIGLGHYRQLYHLHKLLATSLLSSPDPHQWLNVQQSTGSCAILVLVFMVTCFCKFIVSLLITFSSHSTICVRHLLNVMPKFECQILLYSQTKKKIFVLHHRILLLACCNDHLYICRENVWPHTIMGLLHAPIQTLVNISYPSALAYCKT